MNKIFKIFLLIISGIVALAVVSGAIFGFKAYKEIEAETCEITATKLPKALEDGESVPVGELITLSVEVKTALSFKENFKLIFELPEGLGASEKIEQKCDLSYGYFNHSLSFSIIPFREGNFAGGKVKILADKTGEIAPKELVVELPEIVSVLPEIPASENPILAGTLTAPSLTEKPLWAFVVATIVFLAFAGTILAILLRRKSKNPEKVVEPWTLADCELATLKSDVQSGKTGAILAVAKISDIVRRYLSKRFLLKADAMTSQEFFKSMEKHDSPLAGTHKQFLQEFLTSADMVKFAGVAATNDLVFDAIDRAGTLVKETVPTHEAEEKK